MIVLHLVDVSRDQKYEFKRTDYDHCSLCSAKLTRRIYTHKSAYPSKHWVSNGTKYHCTSMCVFVYKTPTKKAAVHITE